MNKRPLLLLTMGDVNGVGPEILAAVLARPETRQCCRPVVIGCAAVLEKAREQFPACPPPAALSDPAEALAAEDAVPVIDAGYPAPPVKPGVLDPAAGRCAAEWVQYAVRLLMADKADGMVTCPINKACLHRAGYPWAGHTDRIAEMTGAPDYRMCLFTETMRVVHNTAHLSLRDALDAVRMPRILASIRIGHDALLRMGFKTPRIAVAGLNPHAGEDGAFGREESDEIRPAVEAACREAIAASGPWPPDTLFGRMRDGESDMVIAMYHDQGHIPMKLIAMDEGVNVTLGIPIVRTSADHGTAFDIAWQGRARPASLQAAIAFAARLAGWREKRNAS
jgi:4-phospho-D-threonate 3-dehydrogenase / 4-phospho-D-erythronate 3-dehydrogenase